MSKFNNYDNPYTYPKEEWYIFNDVTYLCDILADKADYPIDALDEFYNRYAEATDAKSMKIELYTFLLDLGIENPAEFDSPSNGLADIIADTPPENMPKVMYLLVHPDDKDVPSSFNAFTYPDYFPAAVQENEVDYQAQEVYSGVLKKALDVRNNKLDARTFNRGLSPEQVVALATNKLDLSKPQEVVEETVALPDETTTSKIESLKESKKDKILTKPKINLNDLLNKDE
jgi:hypothetical protein